MAHRGLFLAVLVSVGLHVVPILSWQSSDDAEKFQSSLTLVTFRSELANVIQPAQVTAVKTEKATKNSVSAKNFNNALPDAFEKSEQSDSAVNQPSAEPSDPLGSSINAKPTAGWILNTESISANQVIVLNLVLHIDKNGNLFKYEVIKSSASDEQTQLLLADFGATSFAPALKAGAPVDTIFEVEIKVDNLDVSIDQTADR